MTKVTDPMTNGTIPAANRNVPTVLAIPATNRNVPTVLVIDDDITIGNLEQEILEKAGLICLRAYSGTEALLLLDRIRPDLILLDLMLPGLPGEEVLKKTDGIPVIVVSAKINVDDKVALLLNGARDYITKPFSTKELLARVEVQLRIAQQTMRQNQQDGTERYHCGDLTVDTVSRMAVIGEKSISLTKTEYAILKLLIKNPGQVIAKAAILDRIAEDTLDCTESSLKTHVSHLRAKLREAGGREYIESVWGIGFRLPEKQEEK